MKIIRLNDIKGKSITQYESNFIMQKLVMTDKPAHIGIMSLDKNGLVGFHKAAVPQILIIIEGDGWVRAGTGDKVKVTTGNAVFWEKDEWHETFTNEGLKAIVIESEGLDINIFSQK